jgi:hypothetical protein
MVLSIRITSNYAENVQMARRDVQAAFFDLAGYNKEQKSKVVLMTAPKENKT